MSIEINDVFRSFGHVLAVAGMSATVPAGTVTGLVGPNGAGKSTLLLMLAGLLCPDSGEIRIADLDPVAHPRQVHRTVGWMPDAFGTWDSLTCLEILETFADAQGLDRAAGRRRCNEMLSTVHLSEMTHAPARVLSRGQKQRLGLARALLHQPKVLLLDEPAAGMDPRSRADLRVLLKDLASEGVTILISSHILSELEQMIDGAVFMAHGKAVHPPEMPVNSGDGPVSRFTGHVQRQWSMRALDPVALATWATDPQIGGQPAQDGTVVLRADDDTQAASLLRGAIEAGVEVVSFTPAMGLLEETYLMMEAERR